MKRIIAIILSAIMLLGVMSVATFAEDFPNPWELEDFGQKSWTLYLNDKDAPVVDGKVNEGEYSLEIADLEAAKNDEDDRFYNIDFPGDIVVDIYMDYDGDYLYVGIVIDDPDIVAGETLHGLDDRIGVVIGGDKNDITREAGIEVRLTPESVSATNADEVMVSVEGNIITYEFTIDRYTILDKYGFDELEQVYLTYVISDETTDSLTNDALWNEMWFGFATGELIDIYPASNVSATYSRRYPHVVYFVDQPKETEAPVTEAPETEAPATDAPETEAPVTEAPETEAPVAEGGCGASVAAVGVVLVAALGTCTVFVSKKR